MSFIKEKVNSSDVLVNFVPVIEQVADILTTPLTEKIFVPCRNKLGIFLV